jgi:Tfp pilus assembly protein PilF
LNGDAAGAYHGLVQALERPGESADARVWALTLAAEIAGRRGDAAAAELHFREALALDARDAYLMGAYADFLLDQGRVREVVPLLAGHTQNDVLLLRLALAEQGIAERHADFVAHRRNLTERFAAAKQRGDTLHLREEARFRLDIENDAPAALALAKENWKVQREPADLRILAAAARTTGDAAAQKTVADWLVATRIEDTALAALSAGPAR